MSNHKHSVSLITFEIIIKVWSKNHFFEKFEKNRKIRKKNIFLHFDFKRVIKHVVSEKIGLEMHIIVAGRPGWPFL